MTLPEIEAATCTECGEHEDNFMKTETEMMLENEHVAHNVRCSCGETGMVAVNKDGTHSTGNISFEDAPWNEGDNDE